MNIFIYTDSEVRFPRHTGQSYKKICEEWINEKFEEYSSKKEIDFDKMNEDLYDDFDRKIKDAEKEGIFKEDDEKALESMQIFIEKLWSSFDLKDLHTNK